MYYGAMEAGGTKIISAVGTADGKIIEQIEVPTQSPEETLPQLVEFYKQYELSAMGIGTFGPVELQAASKDYGCILNSPKKQWKGFNFYQYFTEQLGCKVVVDTDVNAAALGESRSGALQGVSNGLYLTIGTGIGAGIIVNGELLHGSRHPEAGHILLQKHESDLTECSCGYHTNCFEALAAGPSLELRTKISGADIPKDHAVWELETFYIAQALVDYTLILATERIVLGGGVMKQKHLFPKIRDKFAELMAGYMDTKELAQMEHFIVPAGLKGAQGIIGALYLGIDAAMNF